MSPPSFLTNNVSALVLMALASLSLAMTPSYGQSPSKAPDETPEEIPQKKPAAAPSDNAAIDPVQLSRPAPALKPAQETAQPILLQADRATFDADSGLYTAEGNVEASYGDRTLTADQVTYNTITNKVQATGNVMITESSGYVLHATSVILDGTLETGLIETFGLIIGENTRLAGASAERGEKSTQIKQAIYSPCKVCKDENDGRPVWQIRALKVTHDREKQTISYTNATLEVLGIPLLYTPWFWHPDPTVERKSGFLVPRAGNSTDLGNFLELPYFWNLAPNYDVTITPMFITQEASLLKGEFRMRTKTGIFSFDGSVTNPDRRDGAGNLIPGSQVRNHLFGQGRFSPDPFWQWGFDVEVASDDTYLKRYNIHERRDELRSRAYIQSSSGRNYAVLESYYFVGLRSTDDQGQTPIILPNIDFEYHADDPLFGGHFSVEGNFLSLQRTQGVDMARISMEGSWQRPWISDGGQVFNFFGDLRGDLYHTRDSHLAATAPATNRGKVSSRILPTVGIEWRYPLARASKRGFQVLEPIAQIVASPSGQNPADIPNEDSQSFEFDDTNLFKANKFPGFDRWEEGLRLNIGLKAAVVGFGPGENSLTFGQTFRQDESKLFDAATGLDGKRSDYVGKLVLTPLKQFRMIHRFRLDKDNFSFRRNEIELWSGTPNYWLEAGYLRLGAELSESGLEPREELTAKTHLKIRGNWSFEVEGIRNIESDQMIRAKAGLIYRDECTDFELTARRRYTQDRDIEPETSIYFRVRFKSLG
jgi:LPS-assembly protein